MKQVISGDVLRKYILDAINLICNTVSATLGPNGNNVLINSRDEPCFVTNDGVTIARNIESDNKIINSILEIVKESSLKTNELVGDGTTTTLVLLQSIYNEGIKKIDNGKSPIILKNELNKSIEKIIKEINKVSRKPTKSELTSIAVTSANDKNIGKFLSNIYFKMKSKYAIKLENGNKDKTYYEIKKGYNIEIDNISSVYFQNKDGIELNNCYILCLKGYLSSLEQISDIINECITNNKNLIIFVDDVEKEVYQELLVYYLSYNKKIFVFTLTDYGLRKEKIQIDIENITKCIIKNIDYESISFDDLGSSDITINKNEVIIYSDNDVKYYIEKLKKELKNTDSEYDKEFIGNRLSKLEKGNTIVYIGGKTKTEIKEKIMRYEDSLCALSVASNGIVLGGGITLLSISDKIKCETDGDEILKKVLIVPFVTISKNSGKDYKNILDDIKYNNYECIYNFKNNELEKMDNTSVLDSKEVLICSLKTAISIASMLLTTNYLVINDINTESTQLNF